MPSLYEILGVEASASPSEVRRAYFGKAKSNHPDHGGDAEAMGAINHAYAILSDPDKRRAYDSGQSTDGPSAADMFTGMVSGLLIGAFNSILSTVHEDDLPYFDLDQALNNLLITGCAETSKVMRADLKELKRLRKISSRLKFNGRGINPLAGHLAQTIEMTKKRFRQHHLERRAMNKALELLEDYEYQFDARPPKPSDPGNPFEFQYFTNIRPSSYLNPNTF